MINIHCHRSDNVWFAIAIDEGQKVLASSFSINNRKDALKSILNRIPFDVPFREGDQDDASKRLLKILKTLYKGRTTEEEFKLAIETLPDFTRKVLELVSKIPRGYVTTYGEISRTLSKKNDARAVGGALASNPFPLLIPCHRVIRSNLEVGGYSKNSEIKRRILEGEGVKLRGKRVQRECLWYFRK